jgi:hypothetical protein
MKRAVQIVLAIAIIGLAIWGWMALHPSPEKVIRSRLNALAKTLSFKSGSGVISKAYNIEKTAEFFTQDVQVDVNPAGFEPLSLHGRDDVMEIVKAAHVRLTSLKVEFPDMNITIAPDGQSAKVNLTGKAAVGGERDISAQEFNFQLKKVDGKWLIYHIETVRTLAAAAADARRRAV